MDVLCIYIVEARVVVWGEQPTFNSLELSLHKPSNSEEGCAQYDSVEDETTKQIAFYVTGLLSCSFGNLVHNAQAANADALFVLLPKTNDLNAVELPPIIPGTRF